MPCHVPDLVLTLLGLFPELTDALREYHIFHGEIYACDTQTHINV